MDTVTHILATAVDAFADRPALRQHGDGPAYTYRQLGALAAAASRDLAAGGVAKGTPVALLCENRPEWATAYFAIHAVGAVCVPIDARLTAGEIRSILHRSRAPLLLVSKALLPTAREAAGPRSPPAVATVENLVAKADGRTGDASARDVGGPAGPEDVAVLSFTSGTTGASKAIVLTHRNIASNVAAGVRRMNVSAEDRLVSILPLNHLFEQTGGLLVPLAVGASVTYPGSLNPRTLLEAMRAARATIVLTVPAMARLLRKRILSALETGARWRRHLFGASRGVSRVAERAGLPLGRLLFGRVHRAFGGHLRFFISGGAPLDPRLGRFFMDLGLPILEGYGLSETAPIVSCNTLAEHALGSVGKPLPGVEVRIGGAGGSGGGVGEVLVRGPNVMQGYFEDADATAEVLRDGWLATGDLGRLDRRGYLYIVGRLKDVIVGESGKNVYPAEVEAVIGSCPHVRDACVLGLAREDALARTEEVVAVVVANEEAFGPGDTGAQADILRREIREACAALADYKRPRLLAVWPGDLPRTTTLKVRKHEVRRRLGSVALVPI